MRIIFIIGLCGSILYHGCSSHSSSSNTSNNSQGANKSLKVSFAIDDSIVVLHDDFTITFVNNHDTMRVYSKNNELVLPALNKEMGYSVLFEYKNYDLTFKGITKKMIFPEQDVEWKFGVDSRPFNNLTGLLTYEEYKRDSLTRKLEYLQFNFLEQGDGIQFVNKIP